MRNVKDLLWTPGKTISGLMDDFASLGYQAAELAQARDVVLKMQRSGAKVFLTFTSNMVTSGLRGFFAQLIELGLVDIAVTTSGAVEEDMMKAFGDDFQMSSFHADDTAMHERGENRIGNLAIRNESYMKFEDRMRELLEEAYAVKKRWMGSELLAFIGGKMDEKARSMRENSSPSMGTKVPLRNPSFEDAESSSGHLARVHPSPEDGNLQTKVGKGGALERRVVGGEADCDEFGGDDDVLEEGNEDGVDDGSREGSSADGGLVDGGGGDERIERSFLVQAARKGVPIYCPGIVDSSFGFHLFLFQQTHSDFIVDTVQDMQRITTDLSFDERKGLIALGGSISKHYAVFSALLSGGFDYAVYLTTAHQSSGSMSGATTQEAKSWGKIKDDAEAATVIGDVTLTFPLMMMSVLDTLKGEGLLDGSVCSE